MFNSKSAADGYACDLIHTVSDSVLKTHGVSHPMASRDGLQARTVSQVNSYHGTTVCGFYVLRWSESMHGGFCRGLMPQAALPYLVGKVI